MRLTSREPLGVGKIRGLSTLEESHFRNSSRSLFTLLRELKKLRAGMLPCSLAGLTKLPMALLFVEHREDQPQL